MLEKPTYEDLLTEISRLEKKLIDSEERFQFAMAATQDGIWDWNIHADQVYYSPGYMKMLGYNNNKFTQDLKFWSKRIHPDDKANVTKLNQGCINNLYDDFEVEYRMLTKHGEWLWVLNRTLVFKRNLSGKAIRIIGTHTNISDWKVSEQKITENKQEIKSIFRSAPTGIGVTCDRIFIQTNKKLENITGYSKSELIGNNSRMLFPSQDEYERVASEKYRQINEMETGTVETQWEPKEGDIIDVLLSATPIDFKNLSKGVTFTALDITERKTAERNLKFQALLLDNIQDHVTATDIEGTILYVNEAEIKTTKRKKVQLLKQSVDIYGEDASKGATQKEIIEKTLTEGNWHGEVVNYTAEGDEVIMDCRTQLIRDKDGNPWRMVGISTDITERKRSENEKELLLTAIEQSPETVVITDAKGDIQYVNSAFETLTGYSKEDVLGQNPRLLKSGEHEPSFYKELWQTISKGAVWKAKIKNRMKDGRLFVEEATISPVKDASGQISNYVGVKRDITEELKIKNQLTQAQKMDTIGTLAGGIAHDFNNILFPILGYSELLKMDTPPKEVSTHEQLDQIHTSAMRAKDLVQQILTFSRQEETEYKPLEIQLILKEAIKLLHSTIPKLIEIKQYVDPDCRYVIADATQIHQVIMNLATNAYQAMINDGGVLDIRFEEIQVPNQEDQLFNVKPGPYARLTVADTGVGMSDDLQSKIFDPFFTTKKKNMGMGMGMGTGMGLSVVHGIVEKTKGYIKVKSKQGQGTKFQVYLPVDVTPTFEPDMDLATFPHQQGNESILLIDDERPIIRMQTQALERLGYKVQSESDPLKALTEFQKNPDKYDLVITDLSMPKMSGDKLAFELLSIKSDIPILMCTGFSDKFTARIASQIGIKAVFMKPVVMKEMHSKIREILDDGK